MKKLCNISLTVIELLLIVLLSLSLVSCNSESDYEKAIKSFNEYKYSETIELNISPDLYHYVNEMISLC